ncbi:pilin [Thiocapsa bogorovii]|nr:pilin [Thiocapsa bogorovii]
MAEYYASHGRLPDVPGNNWLALLRELGLNVSAVSGAASGSFVSRIWWNNGEKEIRIRYGFDPIDDMIIALRADFTPSGQAIWTCYAPRRDGVPVRYLPSTCRG